MQRIISKTKVSLRICLGLAKYLFELVLSRNTPESVYPESTIDLYIALLGDSVDI